MVKNVFVSYALKNLLAVKRAARTFLLSAFVLAFGATASFAQVGVQVQKPVTVPEPSINASGPDADKSLVQKRWDVILAAPSQKDGNKAKSAPAATSPQAATTSPGAPGQTPHSPDNSQKSAASPAVSQ